MVDRTMTTEQAGPLIPKVVGDAHCARCGREVLPTERRAFVDTELYCWACYGYVCLLEDWR